MKTTKTKNEATAPANVQKSSVSKTSKDKPGQFVKHCANRRLSTEAVLNFLRAKLPKQYELAEVVGQWVWLEVSPASQPGLASVLWGLGFHWNNKRQSWQHPCGLFRDRSVTFDPRRKYGSYFAADQKPA